MNESGRNFGVVQKLLEERRKRETESHVKQLLVEEDGAQSFILYGRRISVHKVNKDTIRNTKVLAKLPYRNKLGKLFRIGVDGICSCPATILTLPNRAS